MTRVLTFEEWQEDQLNNTAANEVVLCLECHGEGVVSDECESCGHEEEKCCNTCEESGKVIWGDLSDSDKKKHLNNGRYQDALVDDITNLASWLGKDRISILLEYKLTCYTSIPSKIEHIVPTDSAEHRFMAPRVSRG